MRKILCCLIAISCRLANADMAMSPDMIKEMKNEKIYKTLRCKDPKNLIVCHYSELSPNIDECHIYVEKPKEFKKLGRKGTSYGEEKFCSLKGKDKN